MDPVTKKSCLEEISHTVLDSNGKITVRVLSNNWSLSYNDSLKVLEQWVADNESKHELSKEYIVRGVDKKGNMFITYLNEKKLNNIASKVDKISSSLYSVETLSNSNRLNIPDNLEFKIINLTIKSEKRENIVALQTPSTAAPPPVVKKEEAKDPKPSTSIKPGVASMFSAQNDKKVKEEKKSPEVKAEVKKSPTKSPKKGAKNKKVVGKGSIASFFGNKPAAKPAPSSFVKDVKRELIPVKEEKKESAPAKEEEPKAVKPIKEEKAESSKKEDAINKKRAISDESEDEIPATPKAKPKNKAKSKKPAIKTKANPNKRSRILQICDSSESEEEKEEEREEKFIDFDNDDEMEEKKDHSPEKINENDSKNINKNKRKVKKMITKTFMDDDGYLTTVKEYEMQTDSGEDDDVVEVKETKEKETPQQNGKEKEKETTKSGKVKAPKKDKVTPPTPKTKQGSIMSFFSKK